MSMKDNKTTFKPMRTTFHFTINHHELDTGDTCSDTAQVPTVPTRRVLKTAPTPMTPSIAPLNPRVLATASGMKP